MHNYVQGQPYPAINNSSPMIGPLSATYGVKACNFAAQSPAGFLSTNSSDSPSLQCGPDSYDSSSVVCGMGTLSRKEAMQQKVGKHLFLFPSTNLIILRILEAHVI